MGTPYTIRPGDCFASIAAAFGFADPRLLYDHPDNAALKAERPEPTELVPGDEVIIPDKTENQLEVAAGASHKFKVRAFKVFLELVVKLDDEPVANKPYRLTVGGETFAGTTAADGRLRERVPPTATHGRLELDDPPLAWDLEIGSLQPPTTAEGAAARITNLGLMADPIDADDSDALAIGLRSFQSFAEITVTGRLDDATKSKLESLHDG